MLWPVQGLGFLAASIGGVVAAEEDCLAVLAFLLHRCGMRGLLLPDMAQLQLRMFQLDQLLAQRLPQLQGHFEGITLSTVRSRSPCAGMPLALGLRGKPLRWGCGGATCRRSSDPLCLSAATADDTCRILVLPSCP